MTTLLEQIVRIRAITDAETLWNCTRDYFFAHGARMIAYHHFFLGGPPHETYEKASYKTEGFPAGFLEKLFDEKLIEVNPIADLANRTVDPFFWSDIPGMMALLDHQEAFLGAFAEFAVGDGLAIQVFGPRSRNGTLNIGFGAAHPRLDDRRLKELQLAAQLSHLAFIRMTPDFTSGEVALTPRERDVLEWIAQGKSNPVIAEILGISIHTVDTHIRRIFHKLGVNDRTTAAIKGLGAGLVEPGTGSRITRVRD